jgi:hypothetical protein
VNAASGRDEYRENTMNANLTTLRNLTTAALGATAVAIGTLAMSAPATAATNMQPTCVQHPELYAAGATLGVYSTQRRGVDRDQICKVYDANHQLLGTTTATDYGYYRFMQQPVTPGQVKAR